MPPLDRAALEARNAQPVQVAGTRGPLGDAKSKAVIQDLKARSPETGIFDRHLAIEEQIAGSPLSVGNKATLLLDGEATYKAMLAAMGAAKDHIHVEMYIVEDDEIGQQFAESMFAAVKRGAMVNLLYDSVGSINTPPEFFEKLRAGGVTVQEFNPVNPLKVKKGWEVNERNHRKLIVVDGRVAFVGGINISGVYSSGSSALRRTAEKKGRPGTDRPWRDTQVQLEGPVVAELQKTFVEAWLKSSQEPPPLRNAYPALKPSGSQVVRTLAGWGDNPSNAVYVTLLSAIKSAEQSIHITMAYFVPDPEFIGALQEAARRGVDVKIVLPGFTDFWAVFHAGRSHYADLLDAGVKVYERGDRLLHAKTAVIDGVWSTVGSANMDWRSFLHNHELNAIVLGPEFGAQMESAFARDVAESKEITREAWRERGIDDRAMELAARVWEYWL